MRGKALKGRKKTDNPYAAAMALKNKKRKETTAMNVLQQLARGTRRRESLREAARFVCAIKESAPANGALPEGPRVRVVLITEGLGNRKNMNYYGPECIESAPAVFEGKPCFLNHPSESEDRDIPERRVQDKCGYFKGVKVEDVDGVKSVTGELHFDLSDTGRMGFEKALTSLHYKQEFPGVDAEYVGLSINADGEQEKRLVDWQGETLEVNYVVRFTDAVSTDIVTTPARGGKFLALVESIAGGVINRKEDTNMKKGLKESLESVRALLKAGSEEKDLEAAKKKMAEAHQSFEAFLKEAADSEAGDKAEAMPLECHEGGSTTCPHCGKPVTVPVADDKGEEADKGKGADDKGGAGDDQDDDTVESHRLAVKALLVEAGVDKYIEAKDLETKTLKEAKAEIAKVKKVLEAQAQEFKKETGFVPAGYRERAASGGKNSDADAEFADAMK